MMRHLKRPGLLINRLHYRLDQTLVSKKYSGLNKKFLRHLHRESLENEMTQKRTNKARYMCIHSQFYSEL